MKETVKTIIFFVIACVSIALATLLAPKQVNEDFNDLGTEFFPNYKNPLDAHSLEITTFNPKSASSETFSLQLKNGRWTLPSHYNYPTDAGPRMEKLAAKLIGLKRDEIRTRISADHQSLAVVAPDDASVSSLTGRGTHVVLKDKNSNILCEYIIGNKVPKRQSNFNFVRLAKQNIVYAVRNDVELSTKFDDWVQTNLLEIDSKNIQKVLVNNYSLTEGQVKVKESYTLTREPKSWTSDKLKDKEKLSNEAIAKMAENFAKLKLIDVQKKPEAFAQKLKESSDGNVDPITINSLKEKGYHLSQNGLLSDEGETIITTFDGVVYSLRFGDSFIPENSVEKQSTSRYLLLTVEFDPSAAPAPQVLEQPNKPAETSSEEELKAYEKALAIHKRSQEVYQLWQEQQAKAQTEVQRLQKRYADWYFIIDEKSYLNSQMEFKQLLQ